MFLIVLINGITEEVNMSLISAAYLIVLLDTVDTQPMIVIPQSSMSICTKNADFFRKFYRFGDVPTPRVTITCING